MRIFRQQSSGSYANYKSPQRTLAESVFLPRVPQVLILGVFLVCNLSQAEQPFMLLLSSTVLIFRLNMPKRLALLISNKNTYNYIFSP